MAKAKTIINLHPTLKRQLMEQGILKTDDIDVSNPFFSLLEVISDYYHEVDNTRYTMERAAELSSQEMNILYRELAERREKLQAVLSEGLCFIDKDWYIESLNIKAEKLLNIESKLVVGKTLFKIINFYKEVDSDAPLSEGELTEALTNVKPFTEHYGSMMSYTKQRFPASYAINPIIRNNQFHGAVLVFRDLSEAKGSQQG